MVKSDELKRFQSDLDANAELRSKFEEACKRYGEEGADETRSAIMVKAAADLGYGIGLAEMERLVAESQKLSDDEMQSVAGGFRQCYMGECYWDADPVTCNGNLYCASNYVCNAEHE